MDEHDDVLQNKIHIHNTQPLAWNIWHELVPRIFQNQIS
jgi:hypothetical protein